MKLRSPPAALPEPAAACAPLSLLAATTLHPLGVPHKDARGRTCYRLLHPAHAVPLAGLTPSGEGHGLELFARAEPNDRLVVMRTSSRDALARAAGDAVRLAVPAATLERAAGALVVYCGGCALGIGADRLPTAIAQLAEGLRGAPFATQFTLGEMGPCAFVGVEGEERRVADEQCNLMLNLLVFGSEPQERDSAV